MTVPTLVIAGFDELATELRAAGYAGRVVSVASTSGLRDAIRTELSGTSRDNLVFLFADNLTVDTPQTLDLLIGKLTSSGWKVIILETSAKGQALIEQFPQAGLLPIPHTVNKTLAGLAGVGVPGLSAVPGGHRELTADNAPTPAPTSDWETPSSGWETPSSGWETPASEVVTTSPPAPKPQPEGMTSAPTGWSSAPVNEPDTTTGWSEPTDRPVVPAGPAVPTHRPGPADPWAAPSVSALGGLAARSGSVGGPLGGLSARGGRSLEEHPAPSRGRVIVVCAPKGGVGKSSVVLNLGAYLGRRLQGSGRTVCVVDANFQQADSGKYLGTYKPNITDIAKSNTINQQVVSRHLIHRTDLNLSVLLGPATPLEASPHYINGALYRSVVGVLRQMYDYILVDTPVAELFHDIFDQFVLPEADFLVVTVTPNSTTLINTYLWLRTICAPSPAGGRDFDPAKIGILLNRAEEDIGFDEKDVQEELVAYQFLGSIPETKEWKKANNEGRLVATMNYHELNSAFARVLYAATREPALEDELTAPEPPPRGLLARIKAGRRR